MRIKDGYGFVLEVDKARIIFKPTDNAVVVRRVGEADLVVFMADGKVEMIWEDDREVVVPTCGIDYGPDDEPGHYVCDVPADDRWPHCMKCHIHHKEDMDCEVVEAMMGADEDLLRYAVG
jgi:hypothetical protein